MEGGRGREGRERRQKRAELKCKFRVPWFLFPARIKSEKLRGEEKIQLAFVVVVTICKSPPKQRGRGGGV